MKVVFGEWLPDLPEYDNPGITVAKNVIPAGKSYKPMPDLEPFSAALTARCQGMASVRDNDGTPFTFAGDATTLYSLGGGTWTDVSIATGYTVASDQMWQFAQWGEQVIATQLGNYPQTYTAGTSTLFSNLTTDLKGKAVAVCRDFLVFGNIIDSDGTTPHRVRWSAIGDITDYTVSATTQSDYQDLNGNGGFVQAIVGGEHCTIFQERSIWRMTYVGGAIIFDFDEVERFRGTPAPGSVLKYGGLIAFLSDDGFYIFDGTQSVSISNNKVSRYFWDDVNEEYLDRITGTVNLDKQIMIWSYPSKTSLDGACDKVIMYNYAPNSMTRWAFAEMSTQVIGHVISTAYTLDGLDAVGTNIDLITPSLDAGFWAGNKNTFSAFNADNKLCTFTGDALDAIIETTEADRDGERMRVSKLRPLISGAVTVTLQVGTRNRLQDSTTFGDAASVQASGNVSVRANGLYFRIRANISGGFTDAQGVELVDGNPAGTR